MASCLSCHFITKTPVFASLTNNSNVNNNKNISNSPSLQSTSNPDPPIPITKPKTTLPRKRSRHQNSKFQQNLTLIRIERAVGAGSYRDNEPKGSEQRNSILKGLLPNSDGALEGSVENKLRETGEWVTKKTERGFQSNGKRILVFTFQWILPTYILLFFLAAGIIKLPFNLRLLDDLFL